MTTSRPKRFTHELSRQISAIAADGGIRRTRATRNPAVMCIAHNAAWCGKLRPNERDWFYRGLTRRLT